jgi:ribulose-phosphate 3-epimerase
MAEFKIAPSILSADFAHLGDEVKAVEKAGADYCHFDVMDNHYVPNLTIGPMVAEALNPVTNMPLDVHLMIEPVDDIVPEFAKAGADIITFHPEASRHPHRTIQLIKDQGCRAGIALNPGTPVDWLDYLLDEIDLVLVMSVNPGFGGQAFIESALDKIRTIRKRIDDAGLSVELEVDGGIKADNVARVAEAGADVFVSGSGVFKADDYGARMQEFHDALAGVKR